MAKMTKAACSGCEDNFYNGRNPYGVTECWNFKSAKLKRRYRTDTWTLPTTPGAFTEVLVPNCYRQKGVHFSDSLPNFVKLEDVVRMPKERL